MKSVKEIIKSIFSFPKKICVAIRNSYFRSLRGEENFWVVVFGWGVLLYVGSFFIGFWSIKLPLLLIKHKINIFLLPKIWPFILTIVGVLGIIFVFIYPFTFAFCIMRSSFRSDSAYIVLASIFVIIFTLFHIFAAQFFLGVSLGLLKSQLFSKYFVVRTLSILIVVLMATLFSYITFKTIKTLSTKN